MAKQKDSAIRRLKSKAAKFQAIYAKSRREFSAADLQKFTVEEKGIPLDKVIAEMQKIQRNSQARKA